MSLFVWADGDNEISRFQLIYSTFDGERTFDWSADAAQNYDTESSHYAAPVLNRSVPLNAERLLKEFEGAAEQLDRPIREFVADKICSATMAKDVVEVTADPNSVTQDKFNRILLSVALIIVALLAIFAKVALW